MKKAAAYIRVSTEDQTEYSPDSQIKMIREYAKRNGMIVPDEFIFADEGISGKTTKKRPQFNRMIGLAKKKPKPFEAILLWKFSRFARNRQDSIVYKTMLRKQLGIEVISITENIGDDKMSILMEAMIEAMDEYYSINLAEEVVRGMTEKVSRGEPVNIAPFGYLLEKKQYQPHPEQAQTVRMIFADFLCGMGTSSIARKINAMGILTNRGNRWENRTVEYVLNNPVYTGKIRWNPEHRTRCNYADEHVMVVQGSHPAIITETTWRQTQEKLAQFHKKYAAHARQAPLQNGYLLRGLVKCGACGAALTRIGKGSLQCNAYTHGKCNVSHSIQLTKITQLFLTGLQHAFVTSGFNVQTKKPPMVLNEQEINKRRLKQQEAMLARVKQAYASGIDTLEEYTQNKRTIQAELARLKQENRPAKSPSSPPKKRKTHYSLLEFLNSEELDEEEKNAFLRSFIQKIVFDRENRTIEVTFYTKP